MPAETGMNSKKTRRGKGKQWQAQYGDDHEKDQNIGKTRNKEGQIQGPLVIRQAMERRGSKEVRKHTRRCFVTGNDWLRRGISLCMILLLHFTSLWKGSQGREDAETSTC